MFYEALDLLRKSYIKAY